MILCQVPEVSEEIYLICIWPLFNSFLCECDATFLFCRGVMQQLFLHQMKMFSSHLKSVSASFSSSPASPNIQRDSFKKQTLFHTVRLPIAADTEQLFGSDLASESFSAQLDVGSSQPIKISSWQSQANQVVK